MSTPSTDPGNVSRDPRQIDISLRICLWTQFGPAGSRLLKTQPHPDIRFDYPCTKDGMEQAKEAARKLQEYIERGAEAHKQKGRRR